MVLVSIGLPGRRQERCPTIDAMEPLGSINVTCMTIVYYYIIPNYNLYKYIVHVYIYIYIYIYMYVCMYVCMHVCTYMYIYIYIYIYM